MILKKKFLENQFEREGERAASDTAIGLCALDPVFRPCVLASVFKSPSSTFLYPNLQPLPTSPAIHEQTRTMMLCFWLFVFGVHFAQTSSRSTASHQSGFQSAYQNAVYRSTAHRNALRSDALNGVDRSVRPESRWKRRPDTPVSASSSGQSDQLLAESSEDDPAVEPTPDSSDHAYSAFSYHKKVRFF